MNTHERGVLLHLSGGRCVPIEPDGAFLLEADGDRRIVRSRGRRKLTDLRSLGEFLAILGMKRYDFRVKGLAEYLNKHPVTVTDWVMRGVHRCSEDLETAARIEALDRNLCDRFGGKD